MAEEFGYVSFSRQNMLMDLKIVKIVMILIDSLFPFIDRLNMAKKYAISVYSAQITQTEKKLERADGLATANETIGTLNKTRTEFADKSEAQEKLEERNLIMRADLLNACSEFLKLVCVSNKKIQLSMSNHIVTLTRNLVLSHKVEEYLEELLRNNDDLLIEYSKIKRDSAIQSAASPRTMKNSKINMQHRQEFSLGFDFFEHVASQLKLFPLYTQTDVLLFLSKLTKTDSKSFYMNQNSIFEVIHKADFYSNQLLQLIPNYERQTFSMVACTDQNEKMTLALEDFISGYKHPQYINYLKAQLNLFAALCENRNTITTSFFKKHFPMDVLVHYISMPCINDEFKAILFRLLMVLYIDKNPRRVLAYPISARKYDDDGKSIYTDKPYLRSHQDSSDSGSQDHRHDLKSRNKYIDKTAKSIELPLIDRKKIDRPIAVNQEQRELMLIGDLRTEIIIQIEKKAALMKTSQFELHDFYNDYTLQLLKTLNKMVKFGCYQVNICKPGYRQV